MYKKATLVSFILFTILLQISSQRNYYVSAQATEGSLPNWEPGMMDIHNINTGCGNCTFVVMPDGTSMLIDAGHNSPNSERHVPAIPNSSKNPGLWIVDYINRFYPAGKATTLDYILATHYHSDHIGGVMRTKSTKADYFLTGISEVVEHIPTQKIVERGSDILPPTSENQYSNWLKFITYQKTQKSDIAENFIVGSNSQFTLKYDATNQYSSKFEIRNIVGNGVMWTGTGNNTQNLFPANVESLSSSNKPSENSLSCGIRITYGNFDYWNGGDLSGYPKPGRPSWHDLETPVSAVLDKVEVANANHHGYNDGTNDTWLKTVSPQVMIIQASDALHPNHSTLYRMTTTQLYTPAHIFSTNLHYAAKIVIGDLTEQMKSTQGHIVIRVANGGSSYLVYILDDSDTNYKVKSTFGPYFSVR